MIAALRILLAVLVMQQNGPKTGMGPNVIVVGPEPAVVRLLDYSVVTVEVEGTPDCDVVDPPTIKNLEIQIGPRQSRQVSSFDGKQVRTRSTTQFTIYLKPLAEGIFEIPYFTIRAGAETLKSRSIRLESVKDIQGSNRAFFEVVTSKKSYFVNEPVRLTLRIGIDQALAGNLLQMFNEHLDLPVQIDAPWLDDFPGGVPVEVSAPGRGEQTSTMAANRNITNIRNAGTTTRDGRTFAVYEMERAWIPSRLGEISLASSVLRFRFATKITRNLFGEPVAADRNDGFVYSDALKFEVKPVPDDHRPANFAGAVGQFTILAEATPHELKVGDSLKFRLRIAGEGNIEFLEPPKLDGIEGFHVFGRIDEKKRGERIVTYDLSPLSDSVKQIPSIPFSYFDTQGSGSYKTISTSPIAITVHPLPAGSGLAPLADDAAKRVVAGVDDIFDMKPIGGGVAPVPGPPGPGAAVLALGTPLVAAGAAWWLLRRRERDLAEPHRVRARNALSRYQKSRAAGVGAAEAFISFLADHLHCADAAIVSPDLQRRLEARGAAPEAARRAAQALQRAIDARYSGAPTAESLPFDELAREMHAEWST